MRYCTKCIIPETRPNISFNEEGVCNACTASESKQVIDWNEREKAFRKVVAKAKSVSKGYDCIIPVSGGKDSTWQVITCLEYGLNPLAVTWRSPGRTELGRSNLENLVELGVDHIDYQINPKVEKRFTYAAISEFGSNAIPMHMAIHAIPLRLAVQMQIPLIIVGENPAFEYGASEKDSLGHKIDHAWLKTFGVTNGTTAEDWISDNLSREDLTPYFLPTEKEIDQAGVYATFLGYYFKWDVELALDVACKNGFSVREEGPKTGLYNYADIDDDFISIHHYLKWYKFGFTRLFDNLSIEIRTGRKTRVEALEILKNFGEQRPDQDIIRLCEFLDISVEHFNEILEKFRNHDVWTCVDGTWVIKDFIIADWEWS